MLLANASSALADNGRATMVAAIAKTPICLIILNSSLCYSYHINNVSGVILADNTVVCHVKQHGFYPSGHPFAHNETWRCTSC
ncbi:hypothetical protein LIMNO130_30115 [Limnobacter sp. 130]|nr:hypothetical protein LIMNO130_30115 [Limnobacter sp. 130]